MLRLHVIEAVFKRNFLSYFSGVIGYIFIFAFVGLESLVAFSAQFFANNLANLDQLNAVFPILLLLFVPAITMSTWSEERKQGTDELLFTLPASDLEILLGKYAAVVGVYSVALAFSLSHLIVLWYLGSPDWGLMFATYFGYWVTGCALLGAGMLASSLTSSTAVAYVLAALFCAVPVFIERVPFDSRLLQGLSVAEQFRDFSLGMIPIGGLLYFLSLTVLTLYLNLVLLSRRHWSGGPHQAPMGAHYLLRAAALAAILVSVNAIALGANRRLDLTHEKVYSLTPTTQKVLSNLKPERPVLIQAFVSPEVPRDLVSTRTALIGLLRQFAQYGGDRVSVRIANTEKFTDTAEQAKQYGIDSVEVQSEPNGRIVRDDVFLGVVVTSVDEQVIIPFFDKGTPVEYELTRSIRTVSESHRKSVGILRTDAQVVGGFDMQAFRQLPEWRVAQELKKQYDVKAVGPEELASTTVDVLIAVMPSSLTDPEMQSLVDYISKGKPTLIIDDPYPVFAPGLAPRNPKPRPGGMMGMMGGGGPQQQKADNGKATKLTHALGIAWDSGETVWDQYDPHPEFREWLRGVQFYNVVYVAASNKAKHAFNPDSRITQRLQEVMLFYPGSIRPHEGSKLKFEPLLRSSPQSVTYEWEEYVSSGGMFGGNIPIEPVPKDPRFDQISPVIAARITGSNGDKGGTINVVFVADMDFIANPFFFIRDKEWQGLKLDNITFALNAVDELVGEEALLTLRSRQMKHRTLTTVEASTEAFKETLRKESALADEEAKKNLERIEKRLDEAVDKIRKDANIPEDVKQQKIQIELQNRQRELDVAKQNIENRKKRTLKQSKESADRKIRYIEGRTRNLAILIPPIPPLLLGIFIFALRVQREREGIIPDRLVTKKSA
ncbi:MAG: Gldg family protein [Planctomycetia bacterium]|nr:Gldg family protein [Planctomycetia bacterium]